jgi:hypothetical protein
MPGAVGRATGATRFERNARPTEGERGHTSRPRVEYGCIWAAVLAGAFVALPARAAEFDYGVGLTVGYESNIGRVEVNPQSEIVESLLGGIFFRENTGDLAARVQALAVRRHFVKKTNADDTLGYLDSRGTYVVTPQRFNWLVEDTFQMVQTTITAPGAPSNLTQSNAFSTGPDFIFPISSVNSILMGGRYGRFDIKNSNIDNQRVSGYLRGLHQLSPLARVSLNYEAARVQFEPGAQIYSAIFREDGYVRFENDSALNTTSVILGASRATTYGGGLPVEPSRLAIVTLTQTLSTQTKLRLAFADQLSDVYSDLIAGITGSTAPREVGVTKVVAGPATPFATADVYHSTRGDLGYSYEGTRFLYTLRGGERRVNFINDDINDYIERYGSAVLSWIPSAAMRFDVNGFSSSRDYGNIGRTDVDRTYGAAVLFRPNRNMTVALTYARFVRQSTVDFASYIDNRVALTVGYGSNPADIENLRR